VQPAIGFDVKRSALVLGIGLVAASTLLSGAIHGWMSDRWGPPRNALAAAEKLQDIPDRFGNWELQSSDELAESVLTMLECIGYTFRTYVNQETGETVRVGVLLGPSGAMSVHTPEICFSSRDYTVFEERRRVAIENAGGEFWALTFRANNLDADMLRVYYGWSTGEGWSAPEEPRFTYAGSPFLYKIQLAGSLPRGADPETGDPCRAFLNDFVPVAERYLVKAD